MPAIHYVHKSDATIDVGSDNVFSIAGDDDLVLVGASSVAAVRGSALTVNVSGANDIITIGGDGQYALDGRDDVVTFALSGTLTELSQSRVDVNGGNVNATVDGYDTFGIYGSGDTVTANGVQNGLWIGQNGVNGTGAALDVVNGLTDSTLYEMIGSNVVVNGSYYTALINGDDVLTATGIGVIVKGVGLNDVVNVSGGTQLDVETVTLADGGAVYAYNAASSLGVSNLEVFGDHITLRGFVSDSGLIGSADLAVLTNTTSNFSIGGNGEFGAIDILRTPGGFGSSTDVVANSDVRIVSSGNVVTASGKDRVVVIGNAQDDTDTTGGNIFIINTGLGALSEPDLQSIAVLRTGDVVHLQANSLLYIETTGTTSPSDIIATMSANDTLAVQKGVTVRVPVASGKSEVVFNADDRLALAAHFTSVDDLLNHTVSLGVNALIQFDAAGDQLMLTIPKVQVGTYATEGIIRFA